MAAFDRSLIKEIAKGMVGPTGEGDLPSAKLLNALSKASDLSKPEVEGIFKDLYREATGNSDYEPFIPPGPQMG